MLPTNKNPLRPWLLGLAVLAAAVWLLVELKPVLTPFVVAGVLAYILNPLVDRLVKRGFGRSKSAMLVMFMGMCVLAALLLIIVPMLLSQFGHLSERLPDFLRWLHLRLLPWLNATFHIQIEWNANDMADYLSRWVQQNMGGIRDTASKVVPILLRQSGDALAVLGNIVMLPLLLYYFLLDWKRWTNGIHTLIPRRMLPAYERISRQMDEVLGEFLRGQITVMLIMGLVYGGGLALVGLNSGFAIGMVAGLLVFIPYLGAFTGLLLATVAALLQFDGWHGLLLVWGVFAAGQFLESFFVTPKIVGDRIGLSPFWVIFALMAFGQLLGFVGMLLALPLAAVTLVLVREGVLAYLGSSYYHSEHSGSRPEPAGTSAENDRLPRKTEPKTE